MSNYLNWLNVLHMSRNMHENSTKITQSLHTVGPISPTRQRQWSSLHPSPTQAGCTGRQAFTYPWWTEYVLPEFMATVFGPLLVFRLKNLLMDLSCICVPLFSAITSCCSLQRWKCNCISEEVHIRLRRRGLCRFDSEASFSLLVAPKSL